VIYVFAGKTVRENVGCFCQPLDASSYVSIIISTFGEFAGLLLTSLFLFHKCFSLCGLLVPYGMLARITPLPF